jgi:hypothetical protein
LKGAKLMNKILKFFFIIFLMLISNAVFAEFNIYIEDDFKINNMTYSTSQKGLRQYLEDIKSSQPDLYNRMDPILSDIEGSKSAAWGLMGVGAGIVVAGMAGAGIGLGNQNVGLFFGAFFGGFIIGGVVSLIGFFQFPDEDDVRDFVNRHNQLSPDNPINLTYDINIPERRQLFAAAFQYRF